MGIRGDQPDACAINARAETVATSPLFREAFRRHRCLIAADGFYEWQRNGRTKTPYFVHLRSGRPFGLAGIWSLQRTPYITTVAVSVWMSPHPASAADADRPKRWYATRADRPYKRGI